MLKSRKKASLAEGGAQEEDGLREGQEDGRCQGKGLAGS